MFYLHVIQIRNYSGINQRIIDSAMLPWSLCGALWNFGSGISTPERHGLYEISKYRQLMISFYILVQFKLQNYYMGTTKDSYTSAMHVTSDNIFLSAIQNSLQYYIIIFVFLSWVIRNWMRELRH